VKMVTQITINSFRQPAGTIGTRQAEGIIERGAAGISASGITGPPQRGQEVAQP
jgi:hypothetical protein